MGPSQCPVQPGAQTFSKCCFYLLATVRPSPPSGKPRDTVLHSPVCCPWPEALRATLPPPHPLTPSPNPTQCSHFQETKPSPRLLSLTSFLSPLIDENAVIIVGFRSAGPLVGPRLRRMPQLLILHQLPEPMGLLDAQRGSLIQVENDVRAEREAE